MKRVLAERGLARAESSGCEIQIDRRGGADGRISEKPRFTERHFQSESNQNARTD